VGVILKKKMSKTKKIILWIVGVIVAILAFLWFLGAYGYQIQNYFMAQRQEKMRVESEKQIAAILELQKNDNIGGKTPEETLDLYITALKAGNIELASKYSEISLEKPNYQRDELEGYRESLERDGDLHVVLENMDNIMKRGVKRVWSPTKVSFVYDYITTEQSTSTSIVSNQEIITVRPKGINESVGVSLRLNPYTEVWKIIQ